MTISQALRVFASVEARSHALIHPVSLWTCACAHATLLRPHTLTSAPSPPLRTDPWNKAALTAKAADLWRSGAVAEIIRDASAAAARVPARPARADDQVKVVGAMQVPKLGRAGSLASRQALIHNLVHIENWCVQEGSRGLSQLSRVCAFTSWLNAGAGCGFWWAAGSGYATGSGMVSPLALAASSKVLSIMMAGSCLPHLHGSSCRLIRALRFCQVFQESHTHGHNRHLLSHSKHRHNCICTPWSLTHDYDSQGC